MRALRGGRVIRRRLRARWNRFRLVVESLLKIFASIRKILEEVFSSFFEVSKTII